MTSQSSQQLILPLEGMEGEYGAMLIDKNLDKVEGIASHKVEFNNKRALITATNVSAVLPKAVKAIRDLGYEIITVKKNIPVLNMSCASCASSSQTMLENQTGVVSAAVNYANATALVEYIPSITDPAQLKASLQSIGYDLMIDESEVAIDQLEQAQHNHFKALKQKTIFASLLSIPVVIIGMFMMDMPYANYIMWAFSTPVVFIFGRQFFLNAWKQAKHRSANMDTLVALSTGVAYLFSVFNTLYPHYLHNRGLHAHVYFEASAVVIAFILLGKWLEENAKNNTSSAIKKLMGLQPKFVTRINQAGMDEQISISSVLVGDTILVKPGDKIPVDGTVLLGVSFVDESMISGEPLPIEKTAGEKVYAGTLNQKGSFQFCANKVGGNTMLAQIIKMVQQAQGSKPPVQKLVDKIASVFVPIVIGIALLTFTAWILFGGQNGFTQGLLAMITVLVIACPCALGLATPTALMAGVGKGAENGILIKDAQSLEQAKKINIVVLDKTGTITEGKPMVTDILWLHEDKSAAMALASIERKSEHPLAEAIVKHLNLPQTLPVEQFESITGFGAKASVTGELYFVGTLSLLSSNNIKIDSKLEKAAVDWLKEAKTVVWFANKNKALAVIAIADKIKESSRIAVNQLQANGIEVHMLTGDNSNTAKVIAEQVGIKHYKAEVLPSDKAAYIAELQAQGNIVAMVGDGINDSQALAQADVSIAMGKGSDIAMDVAKMTIISSDLTKIYKAIRLSDLTISIIKQNLFWAFIYNVISIPLAAGILYPINGFLVNPMIAGAAMALSSVSVVSNSLRLRTKTL
jgi:Cu2+-exporting ATPase